MIQPRLDILQNMVDFAPLTTEKPFHQFKPLTGVRCKGIYSHG